MQLVVHQVLIMPINSQALQKSIAGKAKTLLLNIQVLVKLQMTLLILVLPLQLLRTRILLKFLRLLLQCVRQPWWILKGISV